MKHFALIRQAMRRRWRVSALSCYVKSWQLEVLPGHPKRILTRWQTKDSPCGFEENAGDNAINVHIHYLRRKLGSRIVETVRSVGYQLGEAGP